MNNLQDNSHNLMKGENTQCVSPVKKMISLGDDRRLQKLEQVIAMHNYAKSALLEILHAAHELFGYFDKNLLSYIAERLNLPPSHVYGVASFYHLFKFVKPGAHVISVCMGTACYVKGAEEIVSAIEKECNCKRGGSTLDGRLSLFVTRCIGACAMAPVVIIDNEVIGKATKEIVLKKVRDLIGGAVPL